MYNILFISISQGICETLLNIQEIGWLSIKLYKLK